MLELELANVSAAKLLEHCRRHGLQVRIERVAKNPPRRHWHLARPGTTGTLELTESPLGVVIKVHPLRDGGWASNMAQDLVRELS